MMSFTQGTTQKNEEICFVLTFGDLSLLEIITVLGPKIGGMRKVCERIAIVETYTATERINEIYGIHKVAYPLIDIEQISYLPQILCRIISNQNEKLRVSLSAYCGITEVLHSEIFSKVLSVFKQAGFRHVKAVRVSEAKSNYIKKRDIIDIVTFQDSGKIFLALTRFLPDRSYIEKRVYDLTHKDSRISLSPRLARTLINIANPKRKGVLLDPFCGTGTILIEALSMGIRSVGSDISKKRITRVRENLEKMFPQSDGKFKLLVSDIRDLADKLGERSITSIVTEPILLPTLNARPSMKSALKMLQFSRTLYSEAMKLAEKVLEPGGVMTIVAPVILTLDGREATIKLDPQGTRLRNLNPGKFEPEYPIRLPFESTRFLRRAVYIFEAT
jgi:tRNA G10  N-methylase Trm11